MLHFGDNWSAPQGGSWPMKCEVLCWWLCLISFPVSCWERWCMDSDGFWWNSMRENREAAILSVLGSDNAIQESPFWWQFLGCMPKYRSLSISMEGHLWHACFHLKVEELLEGALSCIIINYCNVFLHLYIIFISAIFQLWEPNHSLMLLTANKWDAVTMRNLQIIVIEWSIGSLFVHTFQCLTGAQDMWLARL